MANIPRQNYKVTREKSGETTELISLYSTNCWQLPFQYNNNILGFFLHQTKKRIKNETRSGENTFLQYHQLKCCANFDIFNWFSENNKSFCFVRRNILTKKTRATNLLWTKTTSVLVFADCCIYYFNSDFPSFFLLQKTANFVMNFLTKELINLF